MLVTPSCGKGTRKPSACITMHVVRNGLAVAERTLFASPNQLASSVRLPPWLGDDKLHQTHRSALLYKLRDHYSEFGWAKEISDPQVEYLWPRPIEGKEGEASYELCPAFWKKKKSTATKKKQATAKRAPKEKPKRGPKPTIAKNSSDLEREEGRHPSRRLRRSPRLTNK
mmetsp:Transcript_14491/g.31434  ORF Transcript_14491/g.31434 Transcript_14491/m.31434 type:complete len:170 (+) Transcript_14491:272-781(+)